MAITDTSGRSKGSLIDWSGSIVQQHVAPKLTRPTLEKLAAGLFILFLAVVFLLGIVKPEYNWDMAAYMAAALQNPATGASDLHGQIWSLLQANASEAQFYKLTASNPYNVHNYQNPEAFVSMLPMYDVKIAYIVALNGLSGFVGIVNAAIWITALSSLAVGAICLNWARREGFLQATPLLACVMLLCGFFYMSRIATPDLMLAAFFLAGCDRFTRRQDWLATAAFFAAFLVRPDNIIFMFALLLAAIAFRRSLLPAFAGFSASVITYLWITSGNDHPGWWAHFYFSCVEIQNTMIGFDPNFSFSAYFQGLARGAMVSLKDNNWPMVLAVLLMGWALLAKVGKKTSPEGTMLILAIILCIGGKFITFPLPDDRTYMALLVAFSIIVFEAWKPDFSWPKTTQRAVG